MLDLAFVREHLDVVERNMQRRGLDAAATLGRFPELDEARRRDIAALETAQQKRNQLSQRIGELKRKKDPAPAEQQALAHVTAEVASLKQSIPELAQRAKAAYAELCAPMARI